MKRWEVKVQGTGDSGSRIPQRCRGNLPYKHSLCLFHIHSAKSIIISSSNQLNDLIAIGWIDRSSICLARSLDSVCPKCMSWQSEWMHLELTVCLAITRKTSFSLPFCFLLFSPLSSVHIPPDRLYLEALKIFFILCQFTDSLRTYITIHTTICTVLA